MSLPPELDKSLRGLPVGKPLSLEVPGNIARHLASFITAERYARLTEVLSKRTRRLSCFLENVFDPHNLSACMRSCDAFGIQDVHILPQEGLKLKLSGDVSSGSHRWLDHTVYSDVTDAIEHFRSEGYQIVVTDLQGDSPPLNLEQVPIGAKTMVAFGSEHEGISDTLRQAADLRIAVPMHGFVQSLNISVACALTMQRLRERQISETGVTGDLSENQRRRILDRWILNDLPKSRQILEELRRRALEPIT